LSNKLTPIYSSPLLHFEATEPFHILETDIIEISITSKNNFVGILTVTDVFTRKSWFLPIKDFTAKEVYQVLFRNVFSSFFFPKFIYSDQGSAFISELNDLLCKAVGITREYTLPYSKGHTGAVENRNRVVEDYITKYINKIDHSEWDEYCWVAAYAYNKAIDPIRKYSPDYLLFLKNPDNVVDFERIATIPNSLEERNAHYILGLKDAWQKAGEVLKKVLEKASKKHLESLKGNIINFNVGDFVFLSSRCKQIFHNKAVEKKFCPRNRGPFPIKSVDIDHNRVDLFITPVDFQTFHFDDISPYKGSLKPFPENFFCPKLDEVIVLDKIPFPRAPSFSEKLAPEKNKKSFSIKSIVGQRVNVWWPEVKKFFPGTIIGYTASLSQNLIFYDTPTVDKASNLEVDPRVDIYKVSLFPKNSDKGTKWSLLMRK